MECPACGYTSRPGAAFCGRCGVRFTEMVSCPGCGAANPPGHRYCEACGRPLDDEEREAPAATESGEVPLAFVRGRYVVQRLLGEGAKKRVYLAHDGALGRDVAFAQLRAEGLDAESLLRLGHEAEAMGRVGGHPNVVTVFDVGEEASKPYIVSEYMRGGDVAGLLEAADGGRLPLERALDIAADVCRALEHAHDLGVIHRDVKPGNVWLAETGGAKLGDFGLALMDDRTRLSQEGLLYGTPFYMSPEQALGGALDGRSDLYALGALLYELVTGRPPFLGDDPVAVVTQHLETAPVAPTWHNPDVPKALEALILHLLAKAPADRPADATGVLDTIAAIASARRSGPAPAAAATPVEDALDRLAGGVYVGRDSVMRELRAALDAALSGRGRLVLLAGDAGIGKTRAVEELGTYAQLRGCDVLWGRCYEGEAAPPYWPWTQVVRAYARDRGAESLTAAMGPGAAEIAYVVPDLGEDVPGATAGLPAESEPARFRLFDSVTRFFAHAARRKPLVLVLDDLHAADKASLLLLRFLVRELRDARLLVLATCRDAELDRHHPAAETITELTGEPHAMRIVLHGLSEADVGHFIELSAAVAPSPELVAAVHSETDGNPFFVTEVVRLLAAEGKLDDGHDPRAWALTIPDGVRDAVRRRVHRLSDSGRQLLAVAAVVGREFDVAVIERLGNFSEEEFATALEEAIAARVVVDAPRPGGRYRFSHALIRETLYADLASHRRARLHARIGATLEELYGARPAAHLDALAHHFLAAGDAASLEKGIDYAARAARRAGDRLAYEEAAVHYGRALEALDGTLSPDEKHRCELLLALGESHAHAGDPAQAREAFERAADLARELDDSEQLARAALGYGGPWVTFGVVDESLLALLEEARARLGDGDTPLRAMVLARMGVELYFSGGQDRRAELTGEALAIARRLGDSAALAYALNARHGALWGPENAEDRLEVATEIVALAERAASHELALAGHARRVTDLLELGDIPAADREIATHAALAEQTREPAHLWYAAVWRATRAHFAGRFAEAERLAGEAFAVGRRLFESEAAQCHAVQMFFCGVEHGRGAELEESFRRFGTEVHAVPGWHAALAQLYIEIGRPADARRELASLVANDFRDLPRDNTWLPAIACAAEACASLGDDQAAAVLYDLLLPYAGRNVVAVEGWICFGSASRLLGVLAATMGRWEVSQARFDAALALNEQMGARPWLARTQYQYALMLLRRNGPGDKARALDLIEAAVIAARALGMQSVLERALMLRQRV